MAASPGASVEASARRSIRSVPTAEVNPGPSASIAKCARPSPRPRKLNGAPPATRAAVDPVAPRRDRLPVERRHRRGADERFQVAQRQDARLGVIEQHGDPIAVLPTLADPIQRVAAEAIDVVHISQGYATVTDRPEAADRSIASISLWRWTARSKSTSNDPRPRKASAARA